MTTSHLTENELQQAALQPALCTKDQLAHLETCEACQVKAMNYQALFTGLSVLPGPAADYQLQLVVMKKITAEPAKDARPDFSIAVIALVAIAVVGMMAWLNPQFFAMAVSGLSAPVFWLIFLTVVPAAIFYGLMIRKAYRRQMQLLDKL